MGSDRTTETESLQFDQVEFEANEQGAPPQCSRCGQVISKAYYEVGGKIICGTCKDLVEAETVGGSGILRFGKAMALGVPAAALGAGIYYGIAALTGYEFGLVAIVIGLLVGGAVRFGANGRGGWLYQAIAVFLTYVAIASTYIPYIINGLNEEQPMRQSLDAGDAGDAGQMGRDPVSTPLPAMGNHNADQSDSAVLSDDEIHNAEFEDGNVEFVMVLSLGVIFIIAMAAPFLAGFDNIIGLIIIAIGLYEAWKMNKRTDIRISGPFRLAVDPELSESATTNG